VDSLGYHLEPIASLSENPDTNHHHWLKAGYRSSEHLLDFKIGGQLQCFP
jgi:hypothetical protein